MAFQKIGGRLVDAIFGYDFFVSYTWADGSKYADSLYQKLTTQGFTVFLDEQEYSGGDNWTLLRRRDRRTLRLQPSRVTFEAAAGRLRRERHDRDLRPR
jgi:hypothetical protein